MSNTGASVTRVEDGGKYSSLRLDFHAVPDVAEQLLSDAQRKLLAELREQIDTSDEWESHPPIIVHKSDVNRLRRFGMKHNFADSAITLRYALDCLEAFDV